MAIFQDAREIASQRKAVIPGAKRPKKSTLQKIGLGMIGLNEDMTTNFWGKINPALSPLQATIGEAIDPEYNPGKERLAQTMAAGNLALNFTPAGPLAKLAGGNVLGAAQGMLSKQGGGGGATGVPSVGPSTPQMDKINPMTGKPWKESDAPGGYEEHLNWLKENPDMLETDEQRKMLDDALAGRTFNDDVADVMKDADDVDTDAIMGASGDELVSVGDAGKVAKKGQAWKNFGKGLGKAAAVMDIAGDAMMFNKARKTADDAVKRKEMENRRKNTPTLSNFSYT
jgi:hypothetical protein